MFKFGRSLDTAARRRRWGLIGLAAMPVVGAVLYRQGYHLPLHCPILALTGIPCPTCGMTRSFVAIVQGEFAQSAQYHAFGLVLFACFLLAVFHSLLELICGSAVATFYTRLIKHWYIQLGGVLLYFSYYLLRLYWLRSTGEFYAKALLF